MYEKARLSVVIPAWNEEKYIAPTLEALLAAGQTLESAGGAFEVIVVDNASTDRTVECAKAFPVTVISEQRRCIATVRNRGVEAARGEFLAFVDADSRASVNSLERIWRTLSAGKCAGGGVKILPDKWTLSVIPFYGLGPAMQLLLGISAGMIFATREAFDAVGGFDEALYAAEDLEFVRAIKAWGRKCGKKFANLTDVHIKTSTRKFTKASFRDWLIFPRYMLNPASVRRIENCRFWYAEENR
jgi:glycosyltransferase involved in cell wall biosynthesis